MSKPIWGDCTFGQLLKNWFSIGLWFADAFQKAGRGRSSQILVRGECIPRVHVLKLYELTGPMTGVPSAVVHYSLLTCAAPCLMGSEQLCDMPVELLLRWHEKPFQPQGFGNKCRVCNVCTSNS